MDRIKSLNSYQKIVLIFNIAMAVVFTGVYTMTTSHVGFEYNNTIFVPSQENGSMVYSGKIQGQQAHFTVSEDETVVFWHGDKTYGPYTVKEDPTAIGKGKEIAESMIGMEIRQGEDILFRGGVLEIGDSYWLYNEDGTPVNSGVSFVTSDGIERDKNGNAIDYIEPSPSTILELINNPKLTHKGEWVAWFAAVLICVINIIFVLFADELFRWNLAFRIRNVDKAEPSDLEIVGRNIGWTALTIVSLVLFLLGLR